MQSEQINELAAALAKAQGAMKNAAMNRINPHFKSKYADLSAVLDAIRSPLSVNGLSIVQTIEVKETSMLLRTILMHSSGQFITTEYPLPLVGRPHEMGSALTYARRYSIAAIACNSSDEDDDGNVAQDASNKKQTLAKKDAKEIYRKLQDEVRESKSRFALETWGKENVERIAVLPEDWQDTLRLQYQEMMLDLQQQEVVME